MSDNYTNQLKQYQVPAAPQPAIYQNDPRNNSVFLSLHPNTVILPVDEPIAVENYTVITQSNTDQFDSNNARDILPSYEKFLTTNIVPDNLSINQNSFKLQKDSNDGSVFYTVSLTFSDIQDAINYEYRIGIS